MYSYQSINPANNQLLKSGPSHDEAALSHALEVADRLFHSSWRKGDIQPRLQMLKKLADLIDSHAEELATIASKEMGKLIGQSRGKVKICSQIAR